MILRYLSPALFLLPILLLAGCATGSRTVYSDVQPGYRLQLQQPIGAVANGTHLQFQQGQIVPSGNLDRWQTYCRLYVFDSTRDADYRVDLFPGSIRIIDVRAGYGSSDYPYHGRYPGRYHSRHHDSNDRTWGIRDLPAYYLYRVAMDLDSPDQPQLRNLTCDRKWSTRNADKYPTIAEIREALGDYLTLEHSD